MTYSDTQRRLINARNQARYRAAHPEHREYATAAMRKHRAKKRALTTQQDGINENG